MPRLQCRGSIVGAAIVVALLSSRPAAAQVGVDPGPPREPGGLWNSFITGVKYDIVNQALAEHHLQKLQEKLRRDAERGDMAAVDRDVCRIDNLKYRIVIDEWLIRWNSPNTPASTRSGPMPCRSPPSLRPPPRRKFLTHNDLPRCRHR